MTTQESIEVAFTTSEMSELLAEITDALKLSPPCGITKRVFLIRITTLIRQHREAYAVASAMQTALNNILKL